MAYYAALGFFLADSGGPHILAEVVYWLLVH